MHRSRLLAHRFAAWLLLPVGLVTLAAAGAAHAETCLISQDTHPCLGSGADGAACEALLTTDTEDFGARLGLCESHLRAGDTRQALVVVRRGVVNCGSSVQPGCGQLRLAASRLDERLRGETLEASFVERIRAEADVDAARRTCIGPLESELAVVRCEGAILSLGDNPELYTRMGDKLLALGRPARATLAYRGAEQINPSAELAERRARAERQRADMARSCAESDSITLCNNALLKGAPDEAAVQERRGDLLVAGGNRYGGLRAYLEAQRLAPARTAVARKMLPLLTEDVVSTNGAMLRARGDAHVLLGRDADARADYRRVIQLLPGDPAATAALARLAPAVAAAPKPAPKPAPAPAREPEPTRDFRVKCIERGDPSDCERVRFASPTDEIEVRLAAARENLSSGRTQDGRDQLQALLRVDPGHPVAHAMLRGLDWQQASR